MIILCISIILALLTFWDASRRNARQPVLWAVASLVFPIISLPIYLALRPLKAGEIRVGGVAWNIMRDFAILWTLFMSAALLLVFLLFELLRLIPWDTALLPIVSGFNLLGYGVVFLIWLAVLVVSLLIGYALKRPNAIEIGPSNPSTTQRSAPNPRQQPQRSERRVIDP